MHYSKLAIVFSAACYARIGVRVLDSQALPRQNIWVIKFITFQ